MSDPTTGVTPAAIARWHAWLADAPDEPAIQRRLLAAVMALAQADRGYLLSYECGRLRQAVTEQVDYASEVAGGFSASLAEEALYGGEPVYEVDAGASERWSQAASVLALDLKTVLALPYGTPDEIMGVAYVDRQAVDPVLSAADVGGIQLLVDLAALRADAARKSRLADTALADARRERDLVLALAQAGGADARRDLVLAAVRAATGAERTYWLGPGTAGHPAGGDPVSRSLTAHVLATGEAGWHLDARAPEGWEPGQSVHALGLSTLWCWPVPGTRDQVVYADARQIADADGDAPLATVGAWLGRVVPAFGLARGPA